MNKRERENATLNFNRNIDRGAVEETFFPWNLTIDRWLNEGLPLELTEHLWCPKGKVINKEDGYLNCLMTEGVNKLEEFFGFDSIKRLFFGLPLSCFDSKTLQDNEQYIIRQDADGWHRQYFKNSGLIKEIKPPVTCENDWKDLKAKAKEQLEKYYTDENIKRIFGAYREGHKNGEYSIRMSIQGFFWTPRILLGIEEHMYAFYDCPELLHDMNEFFLQVYLDKLGRILDILPADVLYIMEDLSGANGPMLSKGHFDEFVGAYYKKLVPFLKEHGVRNIFVDTDGDFTKLIPNFMDAGIEGFLPMDVNSGVDIVAVRKAFPNLKFIGGFNKLEIAKGKEAIDKEFERLLPVIRQGGYIPGSDHQVAPSTSFENYLYYITKLKETMLQACKDA